jgi:hypothetical protein
MDADDSTPKTARLTRRMVHDLMNHLTTALGNSELMAMELPVDDPNRAPALEVAAACQRAIELVKGWMADEDDE